MNKKSSIRVLRIGEAVKGEEVLADSLYGGDENCEKAKELGVEVISPVMGRSSDKKITLSKFDMSKSLPGSCVHEQ